ncbi:MAG: ureidoglycolate lyase [Neisseriaceae bacterium]|nr:ureidoglycolate lyase [Neisseriaceae bacterium]
MKIIKLLPLQQDLFTPFGDVIEVGHHQPMTINNGQTYRYHRLSTICDIKTDQVSQSSISIFRSIVAKNDHNNLPDENEIYAFITNGKQGVNYRVNTWHHSLISLQAPCDFVVVDRTNEVMNPQHDENLELYQLKQTFQLEY